MDLGTIQKKLLTNKYSHPGDFVADVRLVFENCRNYNEEGSDVVVACATLENAFGLEMRKIPMVSTELLCKRCNLPLSLVHKKLP
jgi:hypothetical protein